VPQKCDSKRLFEQTIRDQRVVQDHSDTFWQDGSSFGASTAPDGIDSASSVDKNTFKQIPQDHWETFKATYPRFDTPDYDTAVQKMLDCGEKRRIAFTCKSSFCLSCAQPRMSQWADFIGCRPFPGVTYRHFILTAPDFLRNWFYQCPDLLRQLMRRGYACLLDIFQTTTGKRARPSTGGRAGGHSMPDQRCESARRWVHPLV